MAALGEDLLSTVNKLQDLVFNTIGSDSLDLPQIVNSLSPLSCILLSRSDLTDPLRLLLVLNQLVNPPSSKTLSVETFCLGEAVLLLEDP